jgi:tetratricopeptide (TPR) repeat protein
MPAPRSILGRLGVACALVGCQAEAPLPPRAVALNDSGVEALETGDLERASSRFALALEHNPRYVEALTNQGLVELERGNTERARQLFERARRLNPDVAQPHHALGVLAERRGDEAVATDHYRAALSVDPGFSPARANLARLLFQAGRLEEAREQFRRLLEVAPDEPAGYAGLSLTLLRLGRGVEAELVALEGQQRFPTDGAIAIAAAQCALHAGDPARARGLLAPIADRHDEQGVAALGWLAVVELAAGRPRHAVGAARAALGLSPDDPLATFALATALAQLADPQAPAWAERARTLGVTPPAAAISPPAD